MKGLVHLTEHQTESGQSADIPKRYKNVDNKSERIKKSKPLRCGFIKNIEVLNIESMYLF